MNKEKERRDKEGHFHSAKQALDVFFLLSQKRHRLTGESGERGGGGSVKDPVRSKHGQPQAQQQR